MLVTFSSYIAIAPWAGGDKTAEPEFHVCHVCVVRFEIRNRSRFLPGVILAQGQNRGSSLHGIVAFIDLFSFFAIWCNLLYASSRFSNVRNIHRVSRHLELKTPCIPIEDFTRVGVYKLHMRYRTSNKVASVHVYTNGVE